MCLLCIEYEKGKLTLYEAQQAFIELAREAKTEEDVTHMMEIAELLDQENEDV